MKLTALRPNNPVAVMAAYGVLRLLPKARLRWDGPHPELEYDGNALDRLTDLLEERMEAPEIVRLDDPRDENIGGVEGYRKLASEIPTDWLVAYGAETAEGIRKTDLLLLGGRHKFVENAREIMTALAAPDTLAKLKEALIGPWRYEDRGMQAWGWDASARIDAASSPKDVSSTPKRGVAGAYWLAWESLPFWPIVNGRTVGFGKNHWIYPTCAEPLGAVGLSSLILGLDRLRERERRALRVTRWQSEVLKPSKYGKVLGWARPLTREPAVHTETRQGSRNTKVESVQ